MLYDVIIIGGGVAGTAIARELSRFRISTALLEKEEELAFGVSKSNSGIIHPGTQNPPGSLKGQLCVWGNRLTREIAGELGVDFKEVGELIVAFNQGELAQLQQIKKDAQALGVPRLKIVNRAWLDKNEPNLSREAIAALYAPTAGIISPYRLVYALAADALANGVEIFTRAKVQNIRRKGDCFEVHTTRGIFDGQYIVNAAGLFADEVAAMAGAGNFTITPRKGEEFLLDKKCRDLTNHLIFPLPSKASKGILVIKTSDGNPMIGPTACEAAGKDDLSTTDEGLANVLAAAKKLVPSIDGKDIIAYFAGLRPIAGDDFIIRAEEGERKFINVAGIQSPGLTAAPAIAIVVIETLNKNGLAFKRKSLFKQNCVEPGHLFSVPLAKTKEFIEKDPAYGDIVCRCELVSAKEIKDAVSAGAATLDGIKFRTRAQAGRCHGSFCTTRIMKILAESTNKKLTEITKRGKGSEIVKGDRGG
jgi:glycerol-3-phosphate dehydrogenase